MKNTGRYGKRIFASNAEITNDTYITGLNNNDICLGASGSGKTGSYVCPNIRNIDGSMVVSDTKGQLEKRFKNVLMKKGYKVYTLDLVNPERSCGYNPLQFIRKYKNGMYREQDILSLANTICPEQDSREPIWDRSAVLYISFLLSYCLEAEPEENHNLLFLGELHRSFSLPDGDIQFVEWIEDHKDSFAAKKFYELKANRQADKMWGSVMGFVNIALEHYDFYEAKYIYARADESENIDIKELGQRKTVLFINNSDTNFAFDNLVNIFYKQALNVLCTEADANEDGRLKVPVRLIMDDFGASAAIDDFDRIISVVRSRDISVSLMIQSLSQLKSKYGQEQSLTILNNCDHILFLGNNDLDTANFIGARAGRTNVI